MKSLDLEIPDTCWHVITVADGDRFSVIIGETLVGTFDTAEEADDVCIRSAMHFRCRALTIGHAPATSAPPAERGAL